MAPMISHFFWSQWSSLPQLNHSFAGQTIIVTGANTGLGFEAAKHLVRLDAARVIIACRSVEKGEKAKQTIETDLKKNGILEVWQLDLSAYESVKQFSKRAESLDRIDAVIENAGVSMGTKSVRNDSGDEMSIATNVIGTMLLCCLMIPLLEKSAQKWNLRPTLTIVTSEVHHFTTFPEGEKEDIFAALADQKQTVLLDRYNVSKIMEVYAVRALAPRLTARKSPVILNMVNPGLCRTELAKDIPFPLNWIFPILQLVFNARTAEAGARTIVYPAYAGEESHGCYLLDCKIEQKAVSRRVRSDEGKKIQEKVWKQLAAKLESIEPGVVSKIVD